LSLGRSCELSCGFGDVGDGVKGVGEKLWEISAGDVFELDSIVFLIGGTCNWLKRYDRYCTIDTVR